MAIDIDKTYTGNFTPSTLSKVKIDELGNYISVEGDINNEKGENLIEIYSYPNYAVCPPKDLLKLIQGLVLEPLDMAKINILNSPYNSDYFLTIIFNNIWEYEGNSIRSDAGHINLQAGTFGLCNKIPPTEGGINLAIDYTLSNNLKKTEEEIIEAQTGTLSWKDKVSIDPEVPELISTSVPSGYENVKPYKVHFGWKESVYGLGLSGADIEFFSEKSSELNLIINMTLVKKDKFLQNTVKSYSYNFPANLIIKNELIQCFPKESYIYDDDLNIVDYGVNLIINANGTSEQYAILKFWSPNVAYLTQQISAFGGFYKSVEIKDLKECVREFYILVTNPGTAGLGQNFRLVFHFDYKDNRGIEYQRDYNVLFKVESL